MSMRARADALIRRWIERERTAHRDRIGVPAARTDVCPIEACAVCIDRQPPGRQIGKAEREAVHVACRAGKADEESIVIALAACTAIRVDIVAHLYAGHRSAEFG